MRAMKEAFTRVLIYFAIALVFMAIFGGFPIAPHYYPFAHRVAYYIGAYISLPAMFALIYEPIVIIRNIRHNRRLKLENQPTRQLVPPYSFTDEGSPQAAEAAAAWNRVLESHQEQKTPRKFSWKRMDDGSYIAEPVDKH
jgi:hypothetical protein